MKKRKLTRAGKIVFTTLFVCMGCSAIHFGILSAEEKITGEYEGTEVLIKERVQKLHSMNVIKQGEVVQTCTYPNEETLCAGITLNNTGLYRNANLPPGEMKEGVFLPYLYEITYETEDGTMQTSSMEIQRKEGGTITSFSQGTLSTGTQEMLIEGTLPSYTFTSDDPEHVTFDQTSVTVSEEAAQEVTITAHDPGNAYVKGEDITSKFVIAHASSDETEGKASVVMESLPLRASPNTRAVTLTPDVWYGSQYSHKVDITLIDKNNAYTKDMNTGDPISTKDESGYPRLRLEAQIVNILDVQGMEDVIKKDREKWTQSEIDQLFKNAPWDTVGYIDLSNYDVPNEQKWTKEFYIRFPEKEDGIYLFRYRLPFTYKKTKYIPLVIGDTEYDKETGYFAKDKIIGQDFTAPIITIEAKRKNETSYHVLQDDEMLGDFAQLKISADGDIAGLHEVKFQFVKRGDQESQSEWKTLSTDGIVSVPNGFDGSIIVYASDQMMILGPSGESNRSTQVEKSIKGVPSSTMKITLPPSSDEWQSISEATIALEVPSDYTTPYDGVLVTFHTQGKDVIDPVYIEKEEFVNNQKTIQLQNGSYTIKAAVVSETQDGYIVVDDAATKTTNLKIDNQLPTIQADIGKQTAYGYEIDLTPTTGPSKIKELKRTFTNDDGTVYTSFLPSNNGQYKDLAELNGTYTYTLTNNAGKSATSKPIMIDDLTPTAPVLNITGKDETGKVVHSGEMVNEFVKVKAENINPDADPNIKIEVCKRTQEQITECKPYTIGEELRIKESGEIIFRDQKDPAHIFGTFDIVIRNSIHLGTITIQNESDYTSDRWYGTDQTINATLAGHEEGVVLQSKVNDGTWNDVTGTTANVSLTSSGIHTVSFRSKKGSEASSSKQVQVNIDKEQPNLTLKKSGTSNKQEIIDFTVQVGQSGLKQAKVSDGGMTLDLGGWIQGSTLKPYTITKNGTYTFTITNGAGKSASASITITDLDESKIQLQQILIQNQSESPYDGTWKHGSVRLEISGGTKETQKLDHYEQSSDNKTWTTCDDTLLFQKEGEQHVSIRAVDQAGKIIDQSEDIMIRIDRTPPENVSIRFTDLHDDAISHFLRSITFDQILNKAQQATMTSADTFSNVTIYYQRAKADGSYEEDLTSPMWLRYENALKFEEEGSVKLYAYAVDEAGNTSDVIDSDQILYDFSAPLLYGIAQEEASGYIPRTITYEDVLSGMDEETSSLTFNKEKIVLSQNMLIKEPGEYEFHLIDLAKNERNQSFTLNAMPKPEDITGSDEDGDLIDEIKKEYEENKDKLDEETRKEIEDHIKELEDAFAKQRITHLEDETSGATLDGEAGTSFAKNTVLKVTRISDQLSEEERMQYEETIIASNTEAELIDVYEVKLMQGEKEVPLNGNATLRIPYEQTVSEFTLVKPEVQVLDFTQEESILRAMINSTGHYAMSRDFDTNTQDPSYPQDPQDPSDPQTPQDTLVNGAYQPSILTGDMTELSIISCLFIGSTLILLMSAVIYKRKRSKHYE